RPEEIIDVSRPHRHRSPRPRPVPIQERPRHASTDYWQPRQGQRPPETPAEKRRGERVRKEARSVSARGFPGPPEGNDSRGLADSLSHSAFTSSTSPRPVAGDGSLSGYTACLSLHAGGLWLPNARGERRDTMY